MQAQSRPGRRRARKLLLRRRIPASSALVEDLPQWLRLLWVPFVTAGIGWGTNWVAVRMLFSPKQPKSFLGVRLQGLIPRRQPEIAAKVADIVERELIGEHFIRNELERLDISDYADRFIRRMVRERLGTKLRQVPVFGRSLNARTTPTLERLAVESVREEVEALREKLATDLESRLRVRHIIQERIEEFDTDQLEHLVLAVAKKEFKQIERLGAILGFVIGCGQVVLMGAL